MTSGLWSQVAYTVTEARELIFFSGVADTVIEALVDKG
jgi:hypothetical protein